MQNVKALFLAVSATAFLSACGGGDSPAPAPAAPPSGASGPASQFPGLASQAADSANIAIDGINDGFFGIPKPAALASAKASERLSAQALGDLPAPACASGTAVATATSITYTNCVLASDPDSKLNGKVTTSGSGAGPWLVNYDSANPLTVTTTGADGKTLDLVYSGQVSVSNLVWSGTGSTATASAFKATLDVGVAIGSSSKFKLDNYVIDYSTTPPNTTKVSLDGQYIIDLKLSDLGIPATVGVPDSITLDFAVSTPAALESTNDVVNKGVFKISSAAYTVELDYTNKKSRFTPTGGATVESAL
jgi:hypothetical protein